MFWIDAWPGGEWTDADVVIFVAMGSVVLLCIEVGV